VLWTVWQYRAARAATGAEGHPTEEVAPRDDPAKAARAQAARKLQIAQEHYQQSMGAYRQLMQDYLKGRVPIQTVQKRAQALRKEANRLEELERAAQEPARSGGN
jgi:hypothetical protein